ncbi:MAG: hypothetical protein KKA10_03585 [Euryarchaeota archaeon]|nr:hypothetical protein [Euryarchaeota archaeon]MCG2736805.1 hypothetical protein [Candidatus Methanoperedenaceae archaeon]
MLIEEVLEIICLVEFEYVDARPSFSKTVALKLKKSFGGDPTITQRSIS